MLKPFSEVLSSMEIATRLDLSAKAIDVHRKQIMDKLNIRSVAELTKFAVREGITLLE